MTASPSLVPVLGQDDILGLSGELPSCSNDLNAQQHNGLGLGYSIVPSTFHDTNVAASNELPSFSNPNNQGISNCTGPPSLGEMPCLPYAVSTPAGTAQPALVSSQPAQQSCSKYGFEQHSHPAGMLQPSQAPSSSTRQDLQPPELGSLADPLCPGLIPGSAVPGGCPTPPRVTDERRSQSHIDRGRSRQLLFTNSSKDLEPGAQQARAQTSILQCTQLCSMSGYASLSEAVLVKHTLIH